MQTFVNEFLFNKLPKLIVLNIGVRCALNSREKCLASFTIESRHLSLDHRNNDVPEVWALLEAFHADIVETKHDLLGCHNISTKLLIDIDDVRGVLRVHQGEVNLVENHRINVTRVVVAAGVN